MRAWGAVGGREIVIVRSVGSSREEGNDDDLGIRLPTKLAVSLGARTSKGRSRRERKRTIDFSRPRRVSAHSEQLDKRVANCDTIATALLADDKMESAAVVGGVLQLCQQGRVLDAAAGVKARASGLSPIDLGRAISAMARTGDVGSLRNVTDTLFHGNNTGSARPARAYTPLVVALLRKGDVEAATEVIERWLSAESFDAQREEAAADLFSPALLEARKARSLSALFGILDVMAAAGAQADDQTFEVVSQAAARSIDFIMGAVSVDTLPTSPDLRDAVLIGRSNVGKSSLVNMLINRKAAFVSKTPGKTQQFNYFLVNPVSPNKRPGTRHKFKRKLWEPPGTFYLVDVPGLGYANAPQGARRDWQHLLQRYLSEHAPLAVVLHLVDSRVGAQRVDLDIFAMLKRAIADRDGTDLPSLRYVLVLTKADKREAVRNLASTAEADLRIKLASVLGDRVAADTPILVTSSVTKRGRDAVWRQLKHAALPTSHF